MSDANRQQIALVVPCCNEVKRLDAAVLLAMVDDDPDLTLLLVDDGSTDGTAGLHAEMVARRPGRIEALNLTKNQGKGEAVRQGLVRVLQGRASIVGYVDADMATPKTEVARLCALFRNRHDCDVLLASRVRLLGRSINRRRLRHYLGRAFATAASLVLRIPVYDTQCGAKLFRRTEALSWALKEPFLSRWGFEVELLGRLLIGTPHTRPLSQERILEEPLRRWADSKGSRLGVLEMVRSIVDLGRIEVSLSKRRRWAG